MQALIARLDPRLRFSRNYAAGLRPYADSCEEQITLLASPKGQFARPAS